MASKKAKIEKPQKPVDYSMSTIKPNPKKCAYTFPLGKIRVSLKGVETIVPFDIGDESRQKFKNLLQDIDSENSYNYYDRKPPTKTIDLEKLRVSDSHFFRRNVVHYFSYFLGKCWN